MKRIFIVLCFVFVGLVNNSFADTGVVQWYNADLSSYETATCTIGGDIILPTPPTKPGYTFVGWMLLLPDGYTELEYIESTGTQYIDTGIYLASNMVVVVKAEQTDIGNIFGYTQGDRGRWMLTLNATASTATLYSDNTNVVGSFSSMPVEITCNMGTGITVNGITTNFTESATRTAPATAWLFKAQGSSATPSGRIYYFKIYQNNNLIINLVPAKNSSGVVGMYDPVSGQFFTNSGTGDFIAGPVVQ